MQTKVLMEGSTIAPASEVVDHERRHEASTQPSLHSTHRLTARTVSSVHVHISCGARQEETRQSYRSLNCFLDGGESSLSRPVGRGGAVRSTGDHRKSVALDWERGCSCASGLCRLAWKRFNGRPSSSRSLNFAATPSRSLLCGM